MTFSTATTRQSRDMAAAVSTHPTFEPRLTSCSPLGSDERRRMPARRAGPSAIALGLVIGLFATAGTAAAASGKLASTASADVWQDQRPLVSSRDAGTTVVENTATDQTQSAATEDPITQASKAASNKLAHVAIPRSRPVRPAMKSADLVRKFADVNARLEDVRRGAARVPPIYITTLPYDLPELQSAKERKRVFIKAVLPLVLKANRRIAREREMLVYLYRAQADGWLLSGFDRRFLRELSKRYGVEQGNWEELLRRVDIVPPSMALAQAAIESGWGTSRFARHGNAMFGQRTFRPGTGMVPKERAEDQSYEVRRFETLYSSIESYIRNLNTHFAYETFRAGRTALRSLDGRELDSLRLIGALESYSETGQHYIDTLRVIITSNRLRQFDDARLDDQEEAALGMFRASWRS